MSATDPYSPTIVDLIAAGSFGTVVEVVFAGGGVTLDAIVPAEAGLTIDASRAPRFQLSLTLPWQPLATRQLLDPRGLAVTATLTAGYRDPSTGLVDAHSLGAFRVVERDVDWLAGTINLVCQSDECIVLGFPITAALALTTSSRIVPAIQSLIAGAFPGETLTWELGDNVNTGAQFVEAPPTDGAIGQDRWSTATDWADAISVVIWHDPGLDVWHLEAATPVPGSETTSRLSTGPGGTVTACSDTTTLDGYANALLLVYRYTRAGVPKVTTVLASTGVSPVVMLTVEKAIAPVNAADVARTMLFRAIRRGHTVDLEAVGELWARPGLAITVDLPDGEQQRLIAESFDFDLAAGTMRATGQAPDSGTVSALPSVTTSTVTANP